MSHSLRLRDRLLPFLAVSTLIAACADGTLAPAPFEAAAMPSVDAAASGATVFRGEEVWPLPPTMGVPCGEGGAISDEIAISGEVRFSWQMAIDAQGNVHSHDLSVTHDARGVSLWTGAVYQVPQTNRVLDNFRWYESVGSNVMRLRFVAPGPENNFTIESHSVWNLEPDGSVRVWFSDYTLVCHTDGANVPGSNRPADPIHEWPDA